MENKKMVYWEKQGVTEYFTYSDSLGYRNVPKRIGEKWLFNDVSFITQNASDHDFKHRENGLVKW